MRTTWTLWLLAVGLLLGLAACEEQAPSQAGTDDCQIDESQIVQGCRGGKDCIPALTDPTLIAPEAATYLTPESRVIGIVADETPIAVPHNILWWHEIVNFNFDSNRYAVTYCPLTGSSLMFDRSAIGGNEFGVSGLLFQNNLIMYDRTSQESLWPQMRREADCGPRIETELTAQPVLETTWEGWQALHPDTRVLSDDTGFSRNYTPSGYPYGNYETPTNDRLLFDMDIDRRRPPKERVLGLPAGEGGLAVPFLALEDAGPVQALHLTVDGEEVVVFWNAAHRGAMAYHPTLDGEPRRFTVRDGRIVDDGTGSTWRLDGQATDGPLAGERIEPVAEAYVSFWFAWAAFQPETRIWGGGP